MNKVKTVFWIIILGLLVIVLYQNRAFLISKQIFQIDLLFLKKQTPKIANGILLLAVFLVGLLIAYFFGLAERFRLKRTIKSLNATLASQTQNMPSTEKEAEAEIVSPSELDPSADNRET